jgi:hypothetical protein
MHHIITRVLYLFYKALWNELCFYMYIHEENIPLYLMAKFQNLASYWLEGQEYLSLSLLLDEKPSIWKPYSPIGQIAKRAFLVLSYWIQRQAFQSITSLLVRMPYSLLVERLGLTNLSLQLVGKASMLINAWLSYWFESQEVRFLFHFYRNDEQSTARHTVTTSKY